MENGVLVDDFTMDDLSSDILKGMYQYWLDIKGDQAMPSRADFHPEDVVNLLPYVNLVDVEHDPNRYKFRLVGTETVKAMGGELTGKYLDDFPKIERHLKVRYDWMVQAKRPYIVTDKLNWSDKSFLKVFSIGLPLSNDGRHVDILMYGSIYTLAEAHHQLF